MRKFLSVCVLVMATLCAVNAIEIAIPPIHYIDERSGEVDKNNLVNKDLAMFFAQEDTAPFLVLTAIGIGTLQAPQSIGDALRIGQNTGNDYLLYGFIARKEYSWNIELKLLDVKSKDVIGFFYGSDDDAHYDRMLKDVSEKLIAFMDEYFSLDLANRNGGKNNTTLSIPIQLGYWTPSDDEMGNIVIGTGKVSTGLEFIPSTKVFLCDRKNYFFSFNLNLAYKYGMGASGSYLVNMHSVSIAMQLKLFCQVSDRNVIYIGAGPVYAIDIIKSQGKYEDQKVDICHTMGSCWLLGYRFLLNDKISFFVECDLEKRYYNPALSSFEPSLGITRTIYAKKVR